jgi:dienelactone hydrolase
MLLNEEEGKNTELEAQPVFGTRLIWGQDIEAVYALPNERTPKGIVLLLHACTHNALKFFSPSPACPSCLGLAEELRVSRLVLSRGYAALAVTCKDKASGCWSNADLPRLDTALVKFRELLFHTSPRLIAIGASSGGHMAANMVAEEKAEAALVMVMSLRPALQKRLPSSSAPLYLAPMPRDQGTTQRVRQNFQALQAAGHRNVLLDDTSCVPLPVTPSYLMGRVPGMTLAAAEQIVRALLEAHHLQPEDFKLEKDPTRSDWRDVLLAIDFFDVTENDKDDSSSLLWGTFLLTPGKSPLAKALHRAWAFHEYCSETVLPALDYFEQVLGTDGP